MKRGGTFPVGPDATTALGQRGSLFDQSACDSASPFTNCQMVAFMDIVSIITTVIERLLANELTRLMRTFPAVGLLGRRQIGKTTLAKAIAADANDLYLERDVPALGPRIPAGTLRRFWTMLAHGQGGLLNAANLARSLAVDGKTVAKYLDLMVDLLLVRRLPPFHANARKRLVKSPKVYVRDSGILHTLLRLDDEESVLGHPVAGKSWEGFAIETLLRASPCRTRASFYRTATGVEADLVLELPRSQLWAIAFKRGVAPRTGRGLATALEDLQPDRAFIVNTGDERYPVKAGVEAMGLREMAGELARLQMPFAATP